ncbi:glycosyltransferase [Acinetobacter haemolyticus]|nr:glycosyltransferase [Acinetobacter haemolyticus]
MEYFSVGKEVLVTIYIPTFNRLSLLKRALSSVINQTYQELEIIIVDDCSTDGTQDFLKAISEQDKRIKYFLKDKNGGACESRNIAIQNATGEYITGLDDDDFFLPDRIENFINNRNEDFVILFDNPIIKTNEDVVVNKQRKALNFFKGKSFSYKDLLIVNYIGNQVFIKTKDLQEYGGFDKNMPMWQDMECWFNILSNTNGKALRLNSYSYVVDISHELERISNFKMNKGLAAYHYFCKKHDLNEKDSMLLFCHLYGYDRKLIKLKPLFYKLWCRFDLLTMLNTIKNVFFYLRK